MGDGGTTGGTEVGVVSRGSELVRAKPKAAANPPAITSSATIATRRIGITGSELFSGGGAENDGGGVVLGIGRLGVETASAVSALGSGRSRCAGGGVATLPDAPSSMPESVSRISSAS